MGKSTNFLQFPLTAMNCLWSLTSSYGAWDDWVPQTQTSFTLNILQHFLVLFRGRLFYRSHCSISLLQYSTVTIFANFRSTTVRTAVDTNLAFQSFISVIKKIFLIIFFLSFCSKVLQNLKVTTFWTIFIKCLFSSINKIIASEMHTVNNAFGILGREFA